MFLHHLLFIDILIWGGSQNKKILGCFFFFSVLGFELKHSTIWATPQSILNFLYSQRLYFDSILAFFFCLESC
jgi:hypothetical protein